MQGHHRCHDRTAILVWWVHRGGGLMPTTFLLPTIGKGSRGMSRTVLLLGASVVLALVAACVIALLVVLLQKAEAAFPGRNCDIVFTSRDQCGSLAVIVRVRPDGAHRTPLTCDPVLQDFAQYPAWSADGKRIVFQLDADDSDDMGRDLWTMSANGENRKTSPTPRTSMSGSPLGSPPATR